MNEGAVGRLTLRSMDEGAVMVLDLQQDRDLVGRGFLMPVGFDSTQTFQRVRLVVEQEMWNSIRRRYSHLDRPLTQVQDIDRGGRVEYAGYPAQYFQVYRPDPVRKVWTGIISDESNEETITYVLEEFRSPEISMLTIPTVKMSLSCEEGKNRTRLNRFSDRCEDECYEACGDGGVRICDVVTKAGSKGCRIECDQRCW